MAKHRSDGSDKKGQLNRRDCMRLGGTALATTALGGAAATTAVAADSEPTDDELTSVLLIDGTVSDELAQYRVVVSGRIEQSDSLSSVVDDGSPWDEIQDRVEGSTASGVVARGVDAYRFSGELVRFQVNGNVDVTLEEVGE